MEILKIDVQHLSSKGRVIGDNQFNNTINALLRGNDSIKKEKILPFEMFPLDGNSVYSGEDVEILVIDHKGASNRRSGDYIALLEKYSLIALGAKSGEVIKDIKEHCEKINKELETELLSIDISQRFSNNEVFQKEPFLLKKYLT